MWSILLTHKIFCVPNETHISKMTIVGFLVAKILSYWSWILLATIIGISIKILLGKKKDVVDPFLDVPEVKPHWFWGNLGSIFGEEHFVKFYDRHYKVCIMQYSIFVFGKKIF